MFYGSSSGYKNVMPLDSSCITISLIWFNGKENPAWKLKCNADTVFTNNCVGLAMCLCDVNGSFLQAKFIRLQFKLSVTKGEAYGLYHALN